MLDESEFAVSTSRAMNRNGPAGRANPAEAGAGVGGGAGCRGAVDALVVVRIERGGGAGSDAGGCGFFPKSHDRKDIVPPILFLSKVGSGRRASQPL